MKQLLLTLLLINPFYLSANGDPCDGPVGCPIVENVKDDMDEVAKYLGVLLVGMAVIGAGAGAVAAGEAGEETSFNIDKNSLSPGLQLMPVDSKFEINSLTIGEFEFSEEFDIDNSQINLLEIKYKFN